MGQSCGGIFVRGNDIEAVREACGAVANSTHSKFLIAPSETAWTAIYPSDAGQNPAVTEGLSRHLVGNLLHLVLHDSDLVACYLYSGGRLVDTFVTIPDYFGEVSDEERREARGRAEAYDEILPPGKSQEDLALLFEELRTRVEPSSAFQGVEDHARLAEFFALPSAQLSYEDLKDDSRSRKGMLEVPDSALERSARRLERSRVEREKRDLAARGVLLCREIRRERGKGLVMHPHPVVAADACGGFFLAWSSTSPRQGPAPLFRVASPWTNAAKETGIELSPTAYSMAASPDGRWLAVGHASGRWEIEIWDLESRALASSWRVARAGSVFGFSPDGRLLVFESESVIHLRELATANAGFSFAARGNEKWAVFHPSSRYLVYPRSPDVVVFDLIERREVTSLRSTERDMDAWYAAALRGEAESGFSPHQLPVHACFDSRGTFLAVATDEGPRVYDWSAIFEARKLLPSPLRAATCPLVRVRDSSIMRGTHSVQFDQQGLLFYCGLEGEIGVLDSETGEQPTAFPVPGTPPLYRAVISSDGKALAVTAHPGLFERQRPPSELQIWSCEALRPKRSIVD